MAFWEISYRAGSQLAYKSEKFSWTGADALICSYSTYYITAQIFNWDPEMLM